MKQNKNNIRKITLLVGLVLAGLTTFKCNAYDLMGQMYTAPVEAKKLMVFVSSASILFGSPITITPGGSPATSCIGGTGIMLGNCVCNTLASSAGLQSMGAQNFHAWMSDVVSTDAACNILGGSGRLPGCNGKNSPAEAIYVDKNNRSIFNSWSDIIGGMPPINTINFDENGTSYLGNVFTGTNNGGTVAGPVANTCNDWIANLSAATATVGLASNTTQWTNTGTVSTCSGGATAYPIYCFEQP